MTRNGKNSDRSASRGNLRLIRGGREEGARMAASGVRITVAPQDEPPFEPDALVLEDDTYSVLGDDAEFREPTEHPIRVWTRVHEMAAAEPGRVLVKPGRPLRLLTVVHDLSEDPSWREEWVIAALDAVLREVAKRKLISLGLQPLGCVHGRMKPDRFGSLLEAALEKVPAETLERIWIIRPPHLDDTLLVWRPEEE